MLKLPKSIPSLILKQLSFRFGSHYDTLELKPGASQQEVKAKYYQLAKKYHPDSSLSQQEKIKASNFIKINEAYQILGDENKRRQYDNSQVNDNSQGNEDYSHRKSYTRHDYSESEARRYEEEYWRDVRMRQQYSRERDYPNWSKNISIIAFLAINLYILLSLRKISQMEQMNRHEAHRKQLIKRQYVGKKMRQSEDMEDMWVGVNALNQVLFYQSGPSRYSYQ